MKLVTIDKLVSLKTTPYVCNNSTLYDWQSCNKIYRTIKRNFVNDSIRNSHYEIV